MSSWAPIYSVLSQWTDLGFRSVVIDRVGALLRPMLHLQCFRAHHDEIFRRNKNEVTPQRVNKVCLSSLYGDTLATLRKRINRWMQVMNMYGQSVQHIKHVLDNLITHIKYVLLPRRCVTVGCSFGKAAEHLV